MVRVENVFEAPATPDTAWALLIDVPRVVPCMPGAELERTVDDSSWEILQRVKLGPISLQFRSNVAQTALNEEERRAVPPSARGRPAAGAVRRRRSSPVSSRSEAGHASRSSLSLS